MTRVHADLTRRTMMKWIRKWLKRQREKHEKKAIIKARIKTYGDAVKVRLP